MEKRVPERTCIGCGMKSHKDELVRIVLYKDDETGDDVRIAVDGSGRMKGRGAYLCRKPECLELAIRKKALNRAFKQAIGQELTDELKESFIKEVK
ncbi:MAG: YlxR family protein [Lachnospiraceae bacterium]|nr:YlxR family protein [Lachnospiraceae bacterium]